MTTTDTSTTTSREDNNENSNNSSKKSTHSFKWVVLDSSPLLLNTITPSIGENFITIREVIDEIIDEESKKRVDSYLKGISNINLKIREPSSESMEIVRNFAKSSGDLASLSHVDLKLCALVVTMELECNRENTKMKMVHEIRNSHIKDVDAVDDAVDDGVRSSDNEDIIDEKNNDDGFTKNVNAKAQRREERKIAAMFKTRNNFEGDWITPENVEKFTVRDEKITVKDEKNTNIKAKTSSQSTRVCCISGDFAVQNIILLMKLPLLSIQNSKRIRQLKNWLLRCHACYHTTKEMHKKFCPHCGNNTLMRTSYCLNSGGDIHLFLKNDFQYNLRGTKAPIPLPRSGQSSSIRSQAHGNGKDRRILLLREDQKEMLQARKSQIWSENRAQKEARSDWHLFDDRLSTIFSNMEVCGGGNGGGKSSSSSIMQPIIAFGRKNPNESRRKV